MRLKTRKLPRRKMVKGGQTQVMTMQNLQQQQPQGPPPNLNSLFQGQPQRTLTLRSNAPPTPYNKNAVRNARLRALDPSYKPQVQTKKNQQLARQAEVRAARQLAQQQSNMARNNALAGAAQMYQRANVQANRAYARQMNARSQNQPMYLNQFYNKQNVPSFKNKTRNLLRKTRSGFSNTTKRALAATGKGLGAMGRTIGKYGRRIGSTMKNKFSRQQIANPAVVSYAPESLPSINQSLTAPLIPNNPTLNIPLTATNTQLNVQNPVATLTATNIPNAVPEPTLTATATANPNYDPQNPSVFDDKFDKVVKLLEVFLTQQQKQGCCPMVCTPQCATQTPTPQGNNTFPSAQ